MTTPKKNVGVYLQDILDAIARIESYASAGDKQFFHDGLLQDAIIRQLSIVGEASSKLPKELRSTQPQIPWVDIVAMRNIIVHDYSETDLPTIWDTVLTDLPVLRSAVQFILADLARRRAA